MSILYWVIEGVGIDAGKIQPFLNKKKLTKMLLKQFPDNEFLNDIDKNNEYVRLDVHDFLYGVPFNNLADLLTYCDDTDSLTYGTDGQGGSYLYYPPSMPWERTANEPDTLYEVRRRIVNAVKSITDLSSEKIEAMIDDDLYIVGCG